METIVALATPAGSSGVAVIRISGEKSKQILQQMIGEKLDFEPRKMYFKKVTAKSIVDDALVVYFAAPNSFTGEDVAEIQSHGGYLLAQKIIEQCLEYGAVMATRGEFSKRAFINGKMSMDQAEGIMDLISAESEMQAKMGSSLLQGKLKTYIEENQNKLTDLLAEMEAKLDYPEYDYSLEEIDGNLKKIEDITKTLKNLIADSKNGLTIKNGVKVAIVGAPNVGKSSLLNALTKSNKAIVTDIAGTTRDVVEAEYEFNGIIFRLCETAGIHESTDVVEQIGITRAKETLQTCDLVLLVSDKDNLCEVKTNKPSISVFNKVDLYSPKDAQNYVLVSATTGENINTLKQLIFDATITGEIDQNKLFLTNTRHIECVKSAIKHLEKAKEIFNTTTLDIVSAEIKLAWLALGEITGSSSDETIIDRVFAKFCLGK
ncbi:MAG: tRNA uridine-5-carboxymethylaminomethyl(34) synthesis GTPase MnmE [Clostridia bacterium]|nr:tRNA uridine-5-carboxymethylaminomethyl(34) synthesis GTPase MnmE [Clostridia bacterium]